MKNKRDRKEKRDRLSDLPDYVLLHIMKSINTKIAVQTCILSTRWKDLWRHLTNLALNLSGFTHGTPHFTSFVSSILYHRDDSVSLHDIDLRRNGCIRPELIDKIMTYANSHDVHSLRLEVDLSFSRGYSLPARIFSCQSLRHLKLSIRSVPCMTQLPCSLHLPALQSLHLVHVTFITNDKGISDPFSNCLRLNTLVLECCNLHREANLLSVSNSNLSSLTIGSTIQEVGYKIVLSTPNLNSITLTCDLIHQISVSDISSLEQVNIDVEENVHMFYEITYSGLISCLQVLANYVKILKLSWSTLKVLLHSFDSTITQLPYFLRLKSLKFKVNPSNILDENVRSLVNCFIKKCPPAIVHIDFRG